MRSPGCAGTGMDPTKIKRQDAENAKTEKQTAEDEEESVPH
jgi:hypothetical protein